MNKILSALRDNFGITCLLLLVAAVGIAVRSQVVTGDEPRYMFYSASIWHHGVLAMDNASWQQLSPSFTRYQMASAPVFPDGKILVHAVYVSTLLSPLAAFGGGGLRLAGLAAGLLGLFLLYRTLLKIVSERAALAAVAITAFSFPLITYIHTYWSEVFMFLGVAAGIYQLDHAGDSQRSDIRRGCVILLVPFIHLRAAVIAAAIFLAFALRVYQRSGWKRVVPLFVVAACLLVSLLAANWSIYGSFSGSITSAHPPAPSELFSVLAMQMTDIKGVFPYAPIWLLGYAGLIAGAVQRRRLVAECLIFALIALATSVGVNPGEGWPARFFVVATPMLAVGLAFWFDRQFGWVRAAISVVLLVITLAVSLVFVRVPNLPLENRQSDGVFQRIYDHLGTFNPGLFLPVEFVDIALSKWLFGAAVLGIGLFALAACSRRVFPAAAALLLVLATLELTRVEDVPFTVTSVSKQQLEVSLPTAPRGAIFQFGKSWEKYYESPTIATILVAATDGSNRPIAANQDIMIPSHAPVSSFTLKSDKMDLAAAASFRAHAYRSRSVLIKAARWAGL